MRQKGGYLQMLLPSVLLGFIPRALRTATLASVQRGCDDATKKREIQTRERGAREERAELRCDVVACGMVLSRAAQMRVSRTRATNGQAARQIWGKLPAILRS